MLQKIKIFVDEYINPGLAMHGGSLRIESFDLEDGGLYVKLEGGCQGCAASNVTLQDQIRACLVEEFSEISYIVDTTEHEKGQNPFYEEI